MYESVTAIRNFDFLLKRIITAGNIKMASSYGGKFALLVIKFLRCRRHQTEFWGIPRASGAGRVRFVGGWRGSALVVVPNSKFGGYAQRF